MLRVFALGSSEKCMNNFQADTMSTKHLFEARHLMKNQSVDKTSLMAFPIKIFTHNV